MRKLLDKHGREIMPGDVLKVFHFIGKRNKKHYMYKIAFMLDGLMKAAHAHSIAKQGLSHKNSYDLRNLKSEHYEIIEGFEGGCFEDRVRHKLSGDAK